MTNKRCQEMIEELGVDCNPMTGIKGNYYTTNREEDARFVIQEIISEREQEEGKNTKL